MGSYFFTAPENYDEKAAKKAWKEDTSAIMDQIIAILRKNRGF